MTDRIALFPGKSAGGPLALNPRRSCACRARFGGESPFFSNPPTTNHNETYRTQSNRQNRPHRPRNLAGTQQLFAEIHKALGYKTKPETFEAIVYSVSTKDKIDPAIVQRIDAKLDHALEILDSLT